MTDAPMLALIETDDKQVTTPADLARIVLLDTQKFDQFYDRMKAETDQFTPDVSTVKGRDECKALAFRVTKTKTALDKAALELTEGWRKQTAQVNAARKPMVERLDALAAEVRKPVTDWETAEAKRAERVAETIKRVRDAAVVTLDDTQATVDARRMTVGAEAPDDDWSQVDFGVFGAAQSSTLTTLASASERLAKEEADRAELARLRAAEDERLAREAEAQAERDRVAAEEQAERDRVAAEEAEQARIAAVEAAAAQRARDEATAAAEAAREAERATEAAALAEERAGRERAERAAQEAAEAAERERLAAADRERIAEAEAAAAKEDERVRQENQELRRSVMGEVADDIMQEADIADRDVVRKVVLAIVAGSVRHTRIQF